MIWCTVYNITNDAAGSRLSALANIKTSMIENAIQAQHEGHNYQARSPKQTIGYSRQFNNEKKQVWASISVKEKYWCEQSISVKTHLLNEAFWTLHPRTSILENDAKKKRWGALGKMSYLGSRVVTMTWGHGRGQAAGCGKKRKNRTCKQKHQTNKQTYIPCTSYALLQHGA